jgi:hypothetical protein
MRILRLDLESGEEIDLHPFVTVLGSLGPSTQRRVAEQLVRIARGDVDGIGGLVEAHGLLIDLDPARISSLALPADADLLVRAEQLPGARLAVTSATDDADRALNEKISALDAEIARIDGELARVTAEIERSTAELDDARRGLDEFAITAHEAAQRALDEARDLARRRAEGAAASGDPTRSPEEEHRDELAGRLASLRERQAHLETLLDEERLGLLELLERLEAERATLDAMRDEVNADSGDDEADLDEPEPEPQELEPQELEPELPDPDDMRAVHAAIREVVEGPPDAPMVPSLPAAALADQVAAHRERHREWEQELVERGLDTAVLRERLEAARRVEAAAAEEARPKTVSPEDDREIERLHDIVTENVDRRESRRHGKEATRLYEEASAELEALLDTYGFPTYAAFIMGRTNPAVDAEARRRHEDAKTMVANVEREIDEVSTAIAEDPHGRMLRAERDQLWSAAEALLGERYEGDVEDALRRLTVPGPVEFDAPDRLRGLLERIGVEVAHLTTTGQLLEVADAWYTAATDAHDAAAERATTDSTEGLLDQESAPDDAPTPLDPVDAQERLVSELFDRSVRLDGELTEREAEFDRHVQQVAAIEAELVALDEASGTGRADTGTPDTDPLAEVIASDPTVVAAREQAQLTATRLERHRGAVERVDQVHGSISESRRTERMLVAQRDGLQVEMGALRGDDHADEGAPLPPVVWTLTEEGVSPIEWYLLGRVASLRSVCAAGSVPLVLDDAFRNLPSDEIATLCDALARIGETVQVIYLGDEPAVAEWAERQGLDHAAVVRPGQPAI